MANVNSGYYDLGAIQRALNGIKPVTVAAATVLLDNASAALSRADKIAPSSDMSVGLLGVAGAFSHKWIPETKGRRAAVRRKLLSHAEALAPLEQGPPSAIYPRGDELKHDVDAALVEYNGALQLKEDTDAVSFLDEVQSRFEQLAAEAVRVAKKFFHETVNEVQHEFRALKIIAGVAAAGILVGGIAYAASRHG
jgi:hypothetical protein